jgi:hypothetical protein
MSSGKLAGRPSLFADISFSDLWRAARYRQLGGPQAAPASLDVAHAARFAAPSQPSGSDIGAVPLVRAFELQRCRQAA